MKYDPYRSNKIFCEFQNKLNTELTRFINKGIGSSPVNLAEQHRMLMRLEPPEPVGEDTFSVKPYQGNNPYVDKLRSYLNDQIGDDLKAVIVHGSVGTYEEVAYSDFDALVIIKDHVFESISRLKHVTAVLRHSLKYMYAFDPLQHHGWFVLSEFDLKALCESYFPAILFAKSKSILHARELELRIRYRASEDEVQKQFLSLHQSITRMLDSGTYRKNLYMLKCLLSQFMLTPAVYLQMKTGSGVWKGDSFEMARPDFSPTAWAAMDHASRIRAHWAYNVSAAKKLLLTRTGWAGDMLRKKCSPAIPKDMKDLITPEFVEDMYRMMQEFSRNEKAILSA